MLRNWFLHWRLYFPQSTTGITQNQPGPPATDPVESAKTWAKSTFRSCLNILAIKSRCSICQTAHWFCSSNPCESGIPQPISSSLLIKPSILRSFLQLVVASAPENPADLYFAGVCCLFQLKLFAFHCQHWIQAALAHQHSDPHLHGNSFTISWQCSSNS